MGKDIQLNTTATVQLQLFLFFDVFTSFSSVLLSIAGAFGCFTNICNMATFLEMGLDESINVSFFGLSISDFFSSFTLLFVGIAMNPLVRNLFFQLSINIFEVIDLYVLDQHLIFFLCGLMITAFIAFERCLCVVIPMKVKQIITPNRVKVFVILVFLTMLPTHAPVHYAYRIEWIHNPLSNRSMLGMIFDVEGEDILTNGRLLIQFFLHACVYLLVIIFTAILLVSLAAKSKWRQSAMSVNSKQADNVANKENKVAKSVLFIATLFIFCSFPGFCTLMAMWFGDGFREMTPLLDRLYMFTQQLNMMGESINITMNIFIYYRTSSKYHASFNKKFSFHKRYPFNKCCGRKET